MALNFFFEKSTIFTEIVIPKRQYKKGRGLPKPPKPGTYREPGSVRFSKTSNRNLTRNQELPGLLPGFYQEFLVQPVTKIAKPGTETETYFLVGSWFRPKYFSFGRPLELGL